MKARKKERSRGNQLLTLILKENVVSFKKNTHICIMKEHRPKVLL